MSAATSAPKRVKTPTVEALLELEDDRLRAEAREIVIDMNPHEMARFRGVMVQGFYAWDQWPQWARRDYDIALAGLRRCTRHALCLALGARK